MCSDGGVVLHVVLQGVVCSDGGVVLHVVLQGVVCSDGGGLRCELGDPFVSFQEVSNM